MFLVKYLENSYSLGIWYDSLVTGQCDKSIKAQCYWLSDLSVVKPRCYIGYEESKRFFLFPFYQDDILCCYMAPF